MNEEHSLREIEIAADGAASIRADLRSNAPSERRSLVVICHGFLAYKRWGFFPHLSERLAGAGFHVLTMSFSHCGVEEETGRIAEPALFERNTVSAELEDFHRVARFVRRGSLGVELSAGGWGVLGHSRGGAVALLAVSEFPEIRSLVTWSMPGRLDRYTARRKAAWRRTGALVFTDSRAAAPLRLGYAYYEDIERNRAAFDLPAAASRLNIPHLMVHGDRDGAVALSETRGVLAAPYAAERHLEVIPGAGHTMNIRHPMGSPSAALERAIALSEMWLRRTLGGERMCTE